MKALRRVVIALAVFWLMVLLLALQCVDAKAQDMRIIGFDGLRTAKGALSLAVPPSAEGVTVPAENAVNTHFSRSGLHTLSLRFGTDSVSAIAGQDSIVAIFPLQERNLTSRLVVVTDSAGVGYGNVYLTNPFSDNISLDSLTRIATKWPVTREPSLANRDDQLFMVNGASAGMRYGAGRTVRYPLGQPGTPKVTPLTDFGGVDGPVFYLVFCSYVDSSALNGIREAQSYQGMYIGPVYADNQKVMLTNFIWQPQDSVMGKVDTIAGTRYRVSLYRTVAGDEWLSERDTFYFCASKEVRLAQYDTMTIVDSLADSAIYAYEAIAESLVVTYDTIFVGGHTIIIITDTLFNGAAARPWIPFVENDPLHSFGRDSNGVITLRYGAPGFVKSYQYGHIYDSIPADEDMVGWSYAFTKFDPETGLEGALSVECDVMRRSGEDGYLISFPRAHSSDVGLKYRIYKAPLFRYGCDTTQVRWERWHAYDANGRDRGTYDYKPIYCDGRTWFCKLEGSGYRPNIRCDSVITGAYRAVDSLVPTTSTELLWADTSRNYPWYNLRDAYVQNDVPEVLSQIFWFGNTMAGVERNNRIRYAVDSTGIWNIFTFQDISPDDGDVITTAWATRTAIRVAKNNTTYNLVDDGTFRPELADNIGCIARNSHQSTPYGELFLSKRGFEIQGEGPFLERTYQTGLLSEDLDNLRKLSLEARRKAVAAYLPLEHIALLCIGDTTYARDFLAQSWATWTFKFRAWCLYDTGSAMLGGRGEQFYFVRPGQSVLCKYRPNDTLSTDFVSAGTARSTIPFTWRSGPLFLDKEWKWQVEAMGISTREATINNLLFATITSDLNSPMGAYGPYGWATLYDSLGLRYRIKEFQTLPVYYSKVMISNITIGGTINFRSLAIDGIDLWARQRERIR